MDVEGWVLLILAVTVPLIAFTLGDNILPWAHPMEILLLILAPICIVLFVYFEAKVATHPIINMTPVFKIRYLTVLLQVFGVIFIFNAVREPHL